MYVYMSINRKMVANKFNEDDVVKFQLCLMEVFSRRRMYWVEALRNDQTSGGGVVFENQIPLPSVSKLESLCDKIRLAKMGTIFYQA